MPSTSHQSELVARPHLAGPLYHQIQSLLRERIHAGEWADSQCMPTEIGLAREYGVSIGTMRKALEKLEHSRLIVRKQGLGTFVNSSRTPPGQKFSRWLAKGRDARRDAAGGCRRPDTVRGGMFEIAAEGQGAED